MTFVKKIPFETIIINAISSFLVASISANFVVKLNFADIQFTNAISIYLLFFIALVSFILLLIFQKIIGVFFKYYALMVISLFYGSIVAFQSNENVLLCFGLSLPLVILIAYVIPRINNLQRKSFRSRFSETTIRNIIIITYILLLSIIVLFNYYAYMTGCDTGIYNQAMYNLANHGQPLYTLDAGGHDREGFRLMGEVVNQMNVHFTPFIYLILPIYYIFQSPVVLLLFQTIVIALAVIPLYKLASIYGISGNFKHILAIAYLLNPITLGCQVFEFHEYCLLPLTILWFLYALEKEHWIGILMSITAVLIVKEDTPIYIVAICIFFFFQKLKLKKNYIQTLVCFIIATLYFLIIVFGILDGGGSFTSRYDNLMLMESRGFFNLIIVFLKNPTYFFAQMFTVEKMIYLLYMILPLGMLPLFALTELNQIFLLIPVVMLNLLPSAFVQYSVHYYFGIGSVVLCIYIVLLNYKKISKISVRKMFATFIVMMTCITAICAHSKFIKNAGYFVTVHDTVSTIDSIFAQIPDSAVVIASNTFTPALSNRENVYIFGLGSGTEEEKEINDVINRDNFKDDEVYVAIDLRTYSSKLYYDNYGYMNYITTFFEKTDYRYEIAAYEKNVCILLKEVETSTLDNQDIYEMILKNDIASGFER